MPLDSIIITEKSFSKNKQINQCNTKNPNLSITKSYKDNGL